MMNCTSFEIEAFPTELPPEPPEIKPPKYKPPYKVSWRTKLLSRARYARKKYTPPPPRKFKPRIPPATPMEDEQLRFRSDQISRGDTRKLVLRKKSKEELMGPKFSKTMDKFIDLSRKSVYNYYKERLRQRRIAKLKRLKEKKKAKKLEKDKKKGKKAQGDAEKEKGEHLTSLAKPKKIFKPERIKPKWKPIEQMTRTALLASPKEVEVQPPKELPVKIPPGCLTYEITPEVLKLTEVPNRLKRKLSQGLPLGAVSKAALRYKLTPRTEVLARPQEKSAAKQGDVDENAEHWIITKNALKYKATPRILELAKPVERD